MFELLDGLPDFFRVEYSEVLTGSLGGLEAEYGTVGWRWGPGGAVGDSRGA